MNPEDRIDYVFTADPVLLIVVGGLLFLLLLFVLDEAFKQK